VYTAALEEGIEPCKHFSAQEVEYKNLEDWSPGNSSEKDETYLNYSMEEALSKSVNTVSVKVLEETGISAVVGMARKMGIQSSLPELPSLVLGTAELRLEELAGAYASYINHGKPVVPYIISTVHDNRGSQIGDFQKVQSLPAAFSDESRLIMLEFMKSAVDKGTASRIRSRYHLKNAIAGKTGTTQNNKDAWFVAITPSLIHASWVGLDHHEIGFKETSLGQGANAALPLFALWMQRLNDKPEFNAITRSKFEPLDESILQKLDCKPVVKDNFFKRLFKNPKKKKSKKYKE
ncbi:MAG: penicillin-binding transpeptidase domain-containing protein, partial [Flavobacteriaceae bacterium]